MEVIFLKDLRKQGKKGEIKKVKDGYALNFLIKNGYALPVNSDTLRELERENKRVAKEKESNKKEALELKEKLEGMVIEFKMKVGKHDRVFGSISAKQVKDELLKKNIKIEKRQIKMSNSVSSLGFHNIEVELYNDIVAKIKLHLVK